MAHIPLSYRWFKWAVRNILYLYYRDVEVYGRTFIPRTHRTLFIANHQSGLMDGLVVVAMSPGVVRTLAKNTLWDNLIIRFFANGLRMIPVYRKQDVESDPKLAHLSPAERNRLAFQEVAEAFLDRELVLLFPEGRSHDFAHILRLRSGAARMLLSTEDEHDFRLQIKWMPISLDFEKKQQPGTKILVHYHPPRSLESYRELYRKDPEAAVEKLRLEMEDYLREVTINFEDWSDRVFIERLTEIWLARSPRSSLLDRHNSLLKWKRVKEYTSQDDASDWSQLRDAVREVYGTLTLLNFSPRDIYRTEQEKKAGFMAKVLFRLLIWSPLIALGLTFWYPPTWLIRWFSRKWAPSMDVRSSYQVVGAFIVYPVWVLLIFPWIFEYLDEGKGLGLFVLAVATGISSLMVSRNLRPEIHEVLALYRYGSLTKFSRETHEKIEQIWRRAARLWNRGLRRQILIETVTTHTTQKVVESHS